MGKDGAFTLIELLVVIAILALLAVLLFPVFQRAKASAQDQACQQNLRQFALANNIYRSDHDGLGYLYALPRPMRYPYNFYDGLAPYLKDGRAVWCPLPDGWEGPLIGHNLYKLQTLTDPVPRDGERIHRSLVPVPGQIMAFCTNHARGQLVPMRAPEGSEPGLTPHIRIGDYPAVREDTSMTKFHESELAVYAYDATGWVKYGSPGVVGQIYRFGNEPWPPARE